MVFLSIKEVTNCLLPFGAQIDLLNALLVEGRIVSDTILISPLLVVARLLTASNWKSETIPDKEEWMQKVIDDD